jgi:hypothetical protein
MPILGGFTRFRQWQFSAAQSAHGTASTPTKVKPWRGTPDINPNWTDIDDVDMGSVDTVLDPYRTGTDVTATLEGPADFNSMHLVGAAGIRGAVAPSASGTANTWTYTGLSTTATTLSRFTASWGDDVTADGTRMWDGVIESIELSGNEDLGPLRISTQWFFGSVNTRVAPVSGLVIGSNFPLMMLADASVYLNNTAATIETTQISDAVHNVRVRITNTIDRKRFANGSNSRFAVDDYGFSAREIEAEITFAKTADIVQGSSSEIAKWISADPVNRFLSIAIVSPTVIPGSATPYSFNLRLPLTWRTRGDGEIGGNTTVTLTGRGKYDSTLAYAIRWSVVNAQTTLP